MIDRDGLLLGRWLLKAGPCDNLFFKDTKRGGWYKFPKTCSSMVIHGEPQGEMLDVKQTTTVAQVPWGQGFGYHGTQYQTPGIVPAQSPCATGMCGRY